MKSAEQWLNAHSQSGPFDLINRGMDAILLVDAIQKDAVSDIDPRELFKLVRSLHDSPLSLQSHLNEWADNYEKAQNR